MGLHEDSGPELQVRRSSPPLRNGYRGARRPVEDDRGTGRPLCPPYVTGARITHIDRAIIRSYFQDSESLPPERRATRRQPTRPSRVSTRAARSSLPAQLERKLSLLPRELERVLVGRDVLLVESDTGAVIDILHQLGTSNA
jgi:hypothetical protein